MFTENLTVLQWLGLPMKIRTKLAEMFEIPKSSYTTVEDNVVTSDGYSTADLLAITPEKCKQFLNSSYKSENNLMVLLGTIVKKLMEEEKKEEIKYTEPNNDPKTNNDGELVGRMENDAPTIPAGVIADTVESKPLEVKITKRPYVKRTTKK